MHRFLKGKGKIITVNNCEHLFIHNDGTLSNKDLHVILITSYLLLTYSSGQVNLNHTTLSLPVFRNELFPITGTVL